jgi:dTDP-4-dehydrorhamnose 3,5-epimerase
LRFRETALPGAYLVEPERHADERGFFARTWCRREFAERGLDSELAQCSVSFNAKRGTWRGMHYQAAPDEEAKLVRCTAGTIWDVIVDLRPESPTFRKHFAAELTAGNRVALYVPKRFAHGFLTLEDGTEVFYQMSAFHAPASARGFRWNDPAFNIAPPMPIAVISERDRSYPDFRGPS